jgi:hypothetical protein
MRLPRRCWTLGPLMTWPEVVKELDGAVLVAPGGSKRATGPSPRAARPVEIYRRAIDIARCRKTIHVEAFGHL